MRFSKEQVPNGQFQENKDSKAKIYKRAQILAVKSIKQILLHFQYSLIFLPLKLQKPTVIIKTAQQRNKPNSQTNHNFRQDKTAMEGQQPQTAHHQQLLTLIQYLSKIFNNLNELKYKLEQQPQPQQHPSNQTKIFLIVGSVSVGKTTVQYFLERDQLKYDVQTKKGLPYIVPVEQYQDAYIDIAPVGITTRVPNVRVLRKNLENKEGEKIVSVQIPDIRELKDDEKTVAYHFVNQILKSWSQIHLLLVITQSSLDNGSDLMEDLKPLTMLFDLGDQQTVTQLSQHVSLIVNKVDPSTQTDQIREKLEQFNDDMIKEQNQELYEIIKQLIKDQRVYTIASEQPEIQKQTQLFSNILQNSKFSSMSQTKKLFEELMDLTDSQSKVQGLIESQQVKTMFEKYSALIEKLLRYLTDENKRQQIFTSDLKQNQLFLQLTKGKQEITEKMAQGKLNPEICLAFESLISLIKQYSESQQFHGYKLMQLVKALGTVNLAILQTLGYQVTKESTQQQMAQQSQQKKKATHLEDLTDQSQFYLKILANVTQSLSQIIEYSINILNYNPEAQYSSSGPQIQKQCLIQLGKGFILALGQVFKDFDLTLLKHKKGKSKRKKQVKKQVFKDVQGTVQDLVHYFQKLYKNDENRKIKAIVRLPNTHFKLILLVNQFRKFKSFIEQPNDESNELIDFRQVVREISQILVDYQLFIESAILWVLVPNWSKILEICNKFHANQIQNLHKSRQFALDEQSLLQINQERKHKLKTLHTLCYLAQIKRRTSIAKRLKQIAEELFLLFSTRNNLKVEPNEKLTHQPSFPTKAEIEEQQIMKCFIVYVNELVDEFYETDPPERKKDDEPKPEKRYCNIVDMVKKAQETLPEQKLRQIDKRYLNELRYKLIISL